MRILGKAPLRSGSTERIISPWLALVHKKNSVSTGIADSSSHSRRVGRRSQVKYCATKAKVLMGTPTTPI
jgi:hypothetical protein